MKTKFQSYESIQTLYILDLLIKNNQNEYHRLSLLNELKSIFDEKYGKKSIYAIVNLFIEPILFYNEEYHLFEPILGFSFLEYIFLDKSDHIVIQKRIDMMYAQKYILIKNPYFISLHTNDYNFIFEYIDEELENKNKKKHKKYNGGEKIRINEELKRKFNKNPYFESYLYTDFIHDFSHGTRTFLSKESMEYFRKYIEGLKIQVYSETQFFKKIRDDLLLPKILKNEYQICSSKDEVGYAFYKLLKRVIAMKHFYIINEASAISFFYLPKDKLDEIMKVLDLHIVKSVGVYMDPYSKSSKVNSVYEREMYYSQICKEIFQDNYFDSIYIECVGIAKNLFEINGHFTTGLLSRRSNSVQTLSIFIEYISSTRTIEDIIKEKLLNIYSSNNNIQAEFKNILKNYMTHHYTFYYTFLSSMTSILLHHLDYFNKTYGKEIKSLICTHFLNIPYQKDKDAILRELKRGHIRENIISYMKKIYMDHKYGNIDISDLFRDPMYIHYIRLYFCKHLYKIPDLFKIILFFTRFKLCGDLLQLIEVDHDFTKYRNQSFINKNGCLITHDRNLGSYASTHKETNYICKSSLSSNEIYLYYRIHDFISKK